MRVRFKHLIYNGYLGIADLPDRGGLIWTVKPGKVDGTVFILKMKDPTELEDIKVSDQVILKLEGTLTRPDYYIGTGMIGNTTQYRTLE